jgi:hypothetical protein
MYKATIRASDADAHHKQMVLDELNKFIEKNADNLKASAYSLHAVQELTLQAHQLYSVCVSFAFDI